MTHQQSKEAARLAFLREFGGLELLPGKHEDVTPVKGMALAGILEAMRCAGLYSRVSPDSQCRWGIRVLVTKLRAQGVA